MELCPECDSDNVKEIRYRGATVIICKECGFDERDELDVSPEYDSSQKAKGEYNKFKVGGGKRSQHSR